MSLYDSGGIIESFVDASIPIVCNLEVHKKSLVLIRREVLKIRESS